MSIPPVSSLAGNESSEAKGGDAVSLDAMFAELEQKVQTAEKSPVWRMRSMSTQIRRLIACLSLSTFIAIAGAIHGMSSPEQWWSVRNFIGLGGLCVLLGLSVWAVTRPMQLPTLSRSKSLGLAMLALVSGLVFAWFSAPGIELGLDSSHAAGKPLGCVSFGFVLALPVYAIMRLLDRRVRLSPLFAAVSAGLAGNLILHLFCRLDSREHEMSGHFPVLAIFVGAALLVEAVGAVFAWHRKKSE